MIQNVFHTQGSLNQEALVGHHYVTEKQGKQFKAHNALAKRSVGDHQSDII